MIAVVLVAIRLVVGATLLWAGFAKVSDPAMFALTVRAYEVLPVGLVNGFAVVMPWMEIAAGLCLVSGFWTRSGALASAALFAAFAVALGINLVRGADISCGCFGLDGAEGGLGEALVRDLLLLAGALVLVFFRRVPFSLDRVLAR